MIQKGSLKDLSPFYWTLIVGNNVNKKNRIIREIFYTFRKECALPYIFSSQNEKKFCDIVPNLYIFDKYDKDVCDKLRTMPGFEPENKRRIFIVFDTNIELENDKHFQTFVRNGRYYRHITMIICATDISNYRDLYLSCVILIDKNIHNIRAINKYITNYDNFQEFVSIVSKIESKNKYTIIDIVGAHNGPLSSIKHYQCHDNVKPFRLGPKFIWNMIESEHKLIRSRVNYLINELI